MLDAHALGPLLELEQKDDEAFPLQHILAVVKLQPEIVADLPVVDVESLCLTKREGIRKVEDF